MHRERGMKTILPLMVGAVIGLLGPAQARSLDAIRSSGVLGLCAHPNSLPFASKAGRPSRISGRIGPGAGSRARRLAEARLDHHPVPDAQRRLRHRAGRHRRPRGARRNQSEDFKTVLSHGRHAGRASASELTSFKSLDEHTKVGVQVGSIAAMIIGQRHVPTSTFGFEVDSLEALANHEIDAAAVTPTVGQLFQSDASGQGSPHPRSRRKRGEPQLECRRWHGPPG